VASSRESTMKRKACSKPAGPTNLSGFHQYDGHAVEQYAVSRAGFDRVPLQTLMNIDIGSYL
jgi:hypothetical protein